MCIIMFLFSECYWYYMQSRNQLSLKDLETLKMKSAPKSKLKRIKQAAYSYAGHLSSAINNVYTQEKANETGNGMIIISKYN